VLFKPFRFPRISAVPPFELELRHWSVRLPRAVATLASGVAVESVPGLVVPVAPCAVVVGAAFVAPAAVVVGVAFVAPTAVVVGVAFVAPTAVVVVGEAFVVPTVVVADAAFGVPTVVVVGGAFVASTAVVVGGAFVAPTAVVVGAAFVAPIVVVVIVVDSSVETGSCSAGFVVGQLDFESDFGYAVDSVLVVGQFDFEIGFGLAGFVVVVDPGFWIGFWSAGVPMWLLVCLLIFSSSF
jgi:hypothetical protein